MIYVSLFSLSLSLSLCRTPWMKHVQKGWAMNTTAWKVGSPPPAPHHHFLCFYFVLHEKLQKHTLQLHSRYSCGSFPAVVHPSPHLLLLHTHPLSPNNVLMRSPLPFTPSSPPPPSLICPPPPPPPAVLCKVPPFLHVFSLPDVM